MTVGTETSRSTYTGNGVTTAFSSGFYFLEAADLAVKHTPIATGIETVLTLGVHYTVTVPTPGSGASGTVTMLVAPLTDDILVIERDVDFTQLTAFRTAGSFSASSHEDAFDRQTFAVQELDRRLAAVESGGGGGGTIVAGSGLTSSGTDPMTLHVGAGAGIQVNTDDVEVLYGPDVVAVDVSANDGGVNDTAARSDHKHNISTAAPPSTAVRVGNSADVGAATSVARSDHQHAVAAGVPVNVTKAAAAEGVAVTFSRGDHKHDITTATAIDLTDSTNGEGSATSLARSDHTHSHGSRGGGSLHAAATSGAAGFMAAADKVIIDRLADLDRVSVAANAGQVFTAGAGATVIELNDDSSEPLLYWDTNTRFNTSTYRFTAGRSGYYRVSGTIVMDKSGGGAWAAGDHFETTLRKNGTGTLWEDGDVVAWAAFTQRLTLNFSTTVYLAASDYLEAMVAATGSNMAMSDGVVQIEELA